VVPRFDDAFKFSVIERRFKPFSAPNLQRVTPGISRNRKAVGRLREIE